MPILVATSCCHSFVILKMQSSCPRTITLFHWPWKMRAFLKTPHASRSSTSTAAVLVDVRAAFSCAVAEALSGTFLLDMKAGRWDVNGVDSVVDYGI